MRVGFRSHKHTKNCLLSVVSLDRSRRAVRDARSRTRGGVDLDAAPAADRERASAGGRARRGRRGRAFSDARVRRWSEEKPSAPPVANDISERRARGERRVRPPSRGPARPRLSHRGARRGDGRAIGLGRRVSRRPFRGNERRGRRADALDRSRRRDRHAGHRPDVRRVDRRRATGRGRAAQTRPRPHAVHVPHPREDDPRRAGRPRRKPRPGGDEPALSDIGVGTKGQNAGRLFRQKSRERADDFRRRF